MKASALIDTAQEEVGDTATPPLCPLATWLRFANQAQQEAARRARLIVDSTTAEICQLSLSAGDTAIDLDPRIMFVRRAKLDGRDVPLARLSHHRLDRERPGWETDQDEPVGYITDMDEGKFRPYPIPTAAGTVNLTVVRLPLVDMKDDSEPELRAQYHLGLVAWMKYRYFSLPDPDINSTTKAAQALSEFESEFGKKSSALDENWLEREGDHFDDEGNF